MYGPTETTVWSTCARIASAEALITIGRPIANTQIQVLDAHGKPCPIGVPGEIYIGGDGVTKAISSAPELTAERFLADPSATNPALVCTAPVTAVVGARTAPSNTWGVWTSRSRCGAIASSWEKSKPRWRIAPAWHATW